MDTDGSSLFLYTVSFIVLLFLGGFFTLAQSSIITLSDAKLYQMVEEKNKKALRVKKITDHPTLFQGTAEFGFLISCILAAVCAFFEFYPLLGRAFLSLFGAREQTAPAFWTNVLSFVLVLIAALLLILIVSHTVPRHLGNGRPEHYAFGCAPGVLFFMALFYPCVKIVQGISAGIASLLGSDPRRQGAEVTEEEIRMMMDVGNEKGVIEESQMEMINNIFEFDDTVAADVMTHRTNVIAVQKDASIGEVVSLAIEEGFSRIPVYEDDIDNIIGAVYVKDLLVLVNSESGVGLTAQNFMRPVMYIPDSAKLPELFHELTSKKAHLAVVIDEYGGTAGILTMEDLLEEIVGNIQDEYDEEDDQIVKVDDRTYTFDGGVSLEDVSKALHVEFEESDDYDTIGGLIIHLLGRIPEPDEEITMEVEGVQLSVLLVEERRIARVKAVLPPAEDAEEGEE